MTILGPFFSSPLQYSNPRRSKIDSQAKYSVQFIDSFASCEPLHRSLQACNTEAIMSLSSRDRSVRKTGISLMTIT
jgi:hypothetical protein